MVRWLVVKGNLSQNLIHFSYKVKKTLIVLACNGMEPVHDELPAFMKESI